MDEGLGFRVWGGFRAVVRDQNVVLGFGEGTHASAPRVTPSHAGLRGWGGRLGKV